MSCAYSCVLFMQPLDPSKEIDVHVCLDDYIGFVTCTHVRTSSEACEMSQGTKNIHVHVY